MVDQRSPESRLQAFDLLASLVSVVNGEGLILFSNAVLEDALGISRRVLVGSALADYFFEPQPLRAALQTAPWSAFSTAVAATRAGL